MMYAALVCKKSQRKIWIHPQSGDQTESSGSSSSSVPEVHTHPSQYLPSLLELQMLEFQMLLPSTLRTTAAGSMPHCHLEIPLLDPEAVRSPKLPRVDNSMPHASQKGVLQSTAALFTFLMVLRHYPHHSKLFNKWAVGSTTAAKIARTGKQDPSWVSWSQGPSMSIKIIEHEIFYWSQATGCTSKEAQEGK